MPYPQTCAGYVVAGVLVAAASGALAQGGPAGPSSTPALAPQESRSEVSTLKANARLVVVDVVVADSKQAPIHNLKASDFTLLENGSAQQITGFEEHIAAPRAASVPPMRPLPPGLFTNFTPTPQNGAINVLLLDALNTPMKDQGYVRDQLRSFLKGTPEGTRIAIFVLTDHLIMLQGFTSDLALLRSAVERSLPGSSRLLTNSAGTYDDVGNGGTAVASDVMSGIGGADDAVLITLIQQSEAMHAAMDTQNRAKLTLDAMNQLAHSLDGIPGRKNLIWFSGSFPITLFPQPDIAHPFWVVASSEDEFRETASILAGAQVAVYPVDSRGLKTNAVPIAVESSGTANSGIGLAKAQNQLFQDRANEHQTMMQMAADTGGRAYLDANNLSDAVGKAIEDGSNYYTLSYTPANTKEDGKFRKIQVVLKQPGVSLAYRKGYFADEPGGKAESGNQAASTKTETIAAVMRRGAPSATEILLKLQVLPAGVGMETAAAAGNVAPPNPAAKAEFKGPFRRYAIDIAANARDIKVTPASDGNYQFSVEVLTFVYDAGGAVINTAVEKARGNLSASSYANMQHVGLPFHQEISVPARGEYFLRIAVRDLETNHYGTVEIPVASVAKLAPLASSAGAAQGRGTMNSR